MRLLPILFLMFSCLAYGQDFDNPNKLPPCSNDQPHNCWGTATWAGGEKYVGEFKDGNVHGRGTITWANGEKYVGEFRDGALNGQGTYIYFDGHKYVGEFKSGKKHGEGILTSPDGKRMEGIFENDNFIREVKVKAQVGKTKSDVAPAPTTNDCSDKTIIYHQSGHSLNRYFDSYSELFRNITGCECNTRIDFKRSCLSRQTGTGCSSGIPKTKKFLDDYFKKHNSCVPKEEWSQVSALVAEDDRDYWDEIETRKKEEKAKADIVLPLARARLKELCQRIPTINILALENLSNKLRVNPNSIQLARVIYDDNSISCEGVVYFPGGTKNFYLKFDNAGLIKNFSDFLPDPYKEYINK
jgi:hypothetical protein